MHRRSRGWMMERRAGWAAGLALCMLIGALAGCGSGNPSPDAGAPNETVSAPPPLATAPMRPGDWAPGADAPPTPIEKPASPVEPAPVLGAAGAALVPVDEAVEENHKKLIGTSWHVGPYDASFVTANRAALKGGLLKDMFPGGTTAKYAFKDNQIEMTILGQIERGTFDGTTLVFAGSVGQPITP